MSLQQRLGPLRDQLRAIPSTLVVALVGCAVAAFVTLSFKHAGERATEAERDVQSVETEMNFQSSLEWQAIGGETSPAELSHSLASSRARLATLLQRLDDQVSSAELADPLNRYSSALDREVYLLETQETRLAHRVDVEQVDPAYDEAIAALRSVGERLSESGSRARVLSDSGIVVSLLAFLALTAAAQSRRSESRRRAERQLEARYRAMVDQSTDLVSIVDRDGAIVYRSPSAERVLAHHGVADLDGLTVLDLVDSTDREPLARALRTVAAGDPLTLEVRVTADGAVRTFEVSLQDLTADPAVGGLVFTAREITERLALQREVRHRTLNDSLTGLPNRVLLTERLEEQRELAARTGASAALLLIDLDRFKDVNDALGHHMGDGLLNEVAERLCALVGRGDTVARLGGDEFAVLLPGIAEVQPAVEVAERLRDALNEPFCVDTVSLDIDASIGVVVSAVHGTDPQSLLRRADVAMYGAKEAHLGVAVYNADRDDNTPDRLVLLGDLRRGLANGELTLFYQPKISLLTGELCGVEALVRWYHPQRGLVPPDAFIPLAENTGLIGPLTEHVLDTAMAQARAWVDAGTPLQVSVNLSARNLQDDDLDRVVVEMLAKHRLDPALLKLEITESAIMEDPERAKSILHRLDECGISVSLDDFGAGYTSIGQLKNLPISELKLDRSFVGTMDRDRSNGVIVRSMVELSHNLGISAVAEGVENVSTIDALLEVACDAVQGYHVSRPLPADAFDAWRAEWKGLPLPGNAHAG